MKGSWVWELARTKGTSVMEEREDTRLMLLEGWEPFGISDTSNGHVYHLRRKVEAK